MTNPNKQAADYLRKAAALIADKDRWTQEAMGLDKDNRECDARSPGAYKRDLFGALISLVPPPGTTVIIFGQFYVHYLERMILYNVTHTHAEVVGAAMHVADIMEGLV